MAEVILPIHSFVDLITNSSSELFVTADRKTVETFKEMIDALLKAGGSEKTCDDLFNFKLQRLDGGYGEYTGLLVTAKDPNNALAAEKLENINNAFTAERIGND